MIWKADVVGSNFSHTWDSDGDLCSADGSGGEMGRISASGGRWCQGAEALLSDASSSDNMQSSAFLGKMMGTGHCV